MLYLKSNYIQLYRIISINDSNIFIRYFFKTTNINFISKSSINFLNQFPLQQFLAICQQDESIIKKQRWYQKNYPCRIECKFICITSSKLWWMLSFRINAVEREVLNRLLSTRISYLCSAKVLCWHGQCIVGPCVSTCPVSSLKTRLFAKTRKRILSWRFNCV